MTGRRALALAVLFLIAVIVIWLIDGHAAEQMGAVDDGNERRGDDTASMLDVEGARGAPPPETGDAASVGLSGTGTTVERGPANITVVDAHGGPVSTVTVGIGPPGAVAQTDADGVAWFDDILYDGSVSANVAIERDGQTLVLGTNTPIRGSELRLRLDDVVPVVVTCRDALTGSPEEPESIELETGRAALSALVGARGERRQLLRVEPEGGLSVTVDVSPPQGFVVVDDVSFYVRRSPYAEAFFIDVPMRRELPLTVVVRDHLGNACPDAEIQYVQAAGKTFHVPRFEVDGFGNRRVSGIPFFAREPLWMYAGIPGTTAAASARGWIPLDPDTTVTLEIDLPEPKAIEGPQDFEEEIGIGGSAGGAFNGRGGRRDPLPQGRVMVRVRRFDGTPAVNARVVVGGKSAVTDADGVAVFVNVAPGLHDVAVTQFGLLKIHGEVVVTDTATADLTLREPRGAALDLVIVDELDRPLPFASVKFLKRAGRVDAPVAWPFEEGGVQRVDPYVDHRGRRRFDRLPADVTVLRVDFGSRHVQVPLELEDGQTKHLRVQIAARPGAPR